MVASFYFFSVPRSAVGNGFRSRGYLCLAVGLLKLLLGIILLSTVSARKYSQDNTIQKYGFYNQKWLTCRFSEFQVKNSAGLTIGCAILLLIAVLCIVRAIYCFTMPISYTDTSTVYWIVHVEIFWVHIRPGSGLTNSIIKCIRVIQLLIKKWPYWWRSNANYFSVFFLQSKAWNQFSFHISLILANHCLKPN